MRAPEFWSGNAAGRDAAPLLQALLAPLSVAYAAAGAHRMARARPQRVGAPVVCVGNLTLGGAGKTPIARRVRAALGADAHVVSRGYGGRLEGPVAATADASARDVGDEPLLHARDGPAWIAKDRVAGAKAAIAAGARAIVLDDGFQNPSLAKDLSILVIDAAAGFGNGKVFPAGPLREPAARGLARADAAVVLRAAQGAPRGEIAALAAFPGPMLEAYIAPLGPPPQGPLIAFAGIARPEKFFETIAAHGAELIDGAAFPDHHPFSESELESLARHAGAHGAQLITTEKDAVRLSPEWRARVRVFAIAARFDDEAALDALLAPIRTRMGG